MESSSYNTELCPCLTNTSYSKNGRTNSFVTQICTLCTNKIILVLITDFPLLEISVQFGTVIVLNKTVHSSMEEGKHSGYWTEGKDFVYIFSLRRHERVLLQLYRPWYVHLGYEQLKGIVGLLAIIHFINNVNVTVTSKCKLQ